jgi:hypothetical protein
MTAPEDASERIDVECKWGGQTFVLPGCELTLTVAELREVASDEILVSAARLKLIGLKLASGRLAQPGDTLGSLRLVRSPDDRWTLSCLCMGTPDALALASRSSELDEGVRNDLDEGEEAPPPTDVMSHFEWLLRRGRLPAPYANLELAWSDDFNQDGLPDPARWEFDEESNRWIHEPSHGELQHYTGKCPFAHSTARGLSRFLRPTGCCCYGDLVSFRAGCCDIRAGCCGIYT